MQLDKFSRSQKIRILGLTLNEERIKPAVLFQFDTVILLQLSKQGNYANEMHVTAGPELADRKV